MQKLRQDLQQADAHAQATDKTGVFEKYGSSTFLTALLTSSEGEQGDSSDSSGSTSDSIELDGGQG